MFQECYLGVFMKYSGVLRIFLKSVVEPNFRKCSGLHVNNSDRVLLLIKLQGFTENDSERELMILFLASCCGGSLFS